MNPGTAQLVPGKQPQSDRVRKDWLAMLDPGVRRYVDILDAHGVETFESCQAGEGHSFSEPGVRFYGQQAEGFRALGIALQWALPVKQLNRYWTVQDGEPVGPSWELVFWHADRSED